MIPIGRTGAQFEAIVEASCHAYRARGEAMIVKMPTPVTPVDGRAVYRRGEKAPMDFVGVAYGLPVAIECKATREMYWPVAQIRPEQWAWANDWLRAGGRAYLLLEVSGQACLIPWPRLLDWRQSRRARIGLADAMVIGTIVRSRAGIPLDFLAPIRADMHDPSGIPATVTVS